MDAQPQAAPPVSAVPSEPAQQAPVPTSPAFPSSETSASDATTSDSSASNLKELHKLQYSQTQLEELLSQVASKPCRVAQVQTEIQGSNNRPFRTKARLIEREIDRIYEAQTLEEIQEAVTESGKNLLQLGVFSRVDVLIHEEPETESDACSVLLRASEKNILSGRAATYLQGVEQTGEVVCSLRNLTGNAEEVSVSYETGTEKSSQWALSYSQPWAFDLPIRVDARLLKQHRNHVKLSSFTEVFHGISLGARSLDGKHGLNYEFGWRNIGKLHPAASLSVKAQAGDYVKSALLYTYLVDKRDSPVMPTNGWAVRASSQLSGLWPDDQLRFARQQLDAQFAMPLSPGTAFVLTGSAGVMLPWGSDFLQKKTNVIDRFFLGGPGTLRGFAFDGVGPSDARIAPGGASDPEKRDRLGGDLYTSLLAQVTFQIPHLLAQALKAHAHIFFNAGNLVQLSGTGKTLPQSWSEYKDTFRCSLGGGLVIPTPLGRFEANYVMVMKAHEHDRIKQGIQLGFAASTFL